MARLVGIWTQHATRRRVSQARGLYIIFRAKGGELIHQHISEVSQHNSNRTWRCKEPQETDSSVDPTDIELMVPLLLLALNRP